MALPLWRKFSGESAVVSLYVVSVLYSTPLSLIPEASFLFLLSLFSLSVEIVADDASNPLAKVFKTRPGASSGIFLSAVTLPGVILSRLIQTQRTEDEIGYAGLQYLRLQYWSAAASCLTVLIYLFWVSQHHVESTNRTHSGFSRSLIYIFVCFILFGGVGMVALCMRSSAWLSMLMPLWLLSHGLEAVLLMKKILRTFPACASIGESLLVTAGLVVYFGDMVAYTATKILYLESSTLLSIQDAFKRSEIATIIQGMLLFLLLFPVIYKNILRISGFCVNQRINEDIRNHEVRKTIVFFALLAVTLIFIAPSWMQYVHDFRVHPLLWILYFVLSEPSKRLPLCIYWLVVICVSVRQFYSISKNGTTERILLRKYYHLMAVCIFVPALVFQPRFLDLAFGAALAVFLLLEIIRIWGIWPLGYTIQRFMTAFTDHRDSDLLIVSHFSLLLGCAIPIWLSSGFNDRPLAPFAGILSLGIGDTMASMVGHKYGVLRWSKTGKKTIEGTAAGITAVLAACFLLLPLLATSGCIFTMHWKSLFAAVTISGLLEAYTAQLDNAFIPLIFYSLLCL